MHFTKVLIIGLSYISLLGGPSEAQELPVKGLGRYEPYRKSMLATGWIPVRTPAATNAQMPEVACGNKMCIAEWRSKQGRVVEITLWFDYDKNNQQVLYVAPQI
jgi:hypothetical protein